MVMQFNQEGPIRYAQQPGQGSLLGSITPAPPAGPNPWVGKGGRDNDAKSWAWAGFQRIFGRAPTEDELAQVLPAYLGTDKHITDVAGGDALVSQMHVATENTPDKLYAEEQKKNLEEAPEHFGSVTELFQNQLGRAPSQEELNHFGSLLASGTTDPYTIGQFLQQQPEYTDKKDLAQQEKLKLENQSYQDKVRAENDALQDQMRSENEAFQGKARGEVEQFQTDAEGKIKGYVSDTEAKNKVYQDQLSGQLAGYDQQYFGERILPLIQQNFAKQGRSFDSSGFANSATQSAQQQNIQRQQALAALGADQYGQLQQQEAAQRASLQGISANQLGGLQNVAAGQYGNLQQQQAAQQAYLQNQTAAQQGYLQNVGVGQYAGRQDTAYQDYVNALNQQQNLTNSGINAQYQQIQNVQTRGQNIQDFNTQSQLYNQYLAKYGKRNNGLGGFIGMAGGAALGGFFGGIPGAQLGANLGGGFGQAGQNAYGGSY